jgi:hypothetical protein
MNFFLKKIQSIIRISVNSIIKFEKKEKIRDDFIEFYRACLVPDNGPLKSSYFSKNIRYYYEGLRYWRLRAENLGKSKSNKQIEEIIEAGESISDFFTIIDASLTIGAILAPSLLVLSIIIDWHPLISAIFLFFAVVLIGLKIYLKILFSFTEEISHLNENLVITQEEVNYGGRFYGKKDSIIAAYIWNRSLCNYSIITSVIILLFIKIASKVVYKRVYDSMIRLLPMYMPEFVKDKSRIKFFKFILSHREK